MASGRSARLPPTPTRHVDINAPNSAYAGTVNVPNETINALGPDLSVATSQVLDSLSDRERQIIFDVLNRDEEVRQRDSARIM